MKITHILYLEEYLKDALEVFNSTGEIQDIFLVFFDQNGKWCDYQNIHFGLNYGRLCEQVIPKSRLVRKCKNGAKVLRSSFKMESDNPIKLNYHHVIGAIEVSTTNKFSAPNLKKVSGGMDIDSETVDLPCLEEVRYQLNVDSVEHFDAPSLKRIYGNLVLGDAVVVHAPKLHTVTCYLEALSARSFHAPRLKTVGQMCLMSLLDAFFPNLKKADGIVAECASRFDAPRLETVANSISLDNADEFYAASLRKINCLNVSSATRFHAANLETVESDLNAQSAVVFEAPKLEKVGGRLRLPRATLEAAIIAGSKAAIAECVDGI